MKINFPKQPLSEVRQPPTRRVQRRMRAGQHWRGDGQLDRDRDLEARQARVADAQPYVVCGCSCGGTGGGFKMAMRGEVSVQIGDPINVVVEESFDRWFHSGVIPLIVHVEGEGIRFRHDFPFSGAASVDEARDQAVEQIRFVVSAISNAPWFDPLETS